MGHDIAALNRQRLDIVSELDGVKKGLGYINMQPEIRGELIKLIDKLYADIVHSIDLHIRYIEATAVISERNE